jgi:hypothetical protein
MLSIARDTNLQETTFVIPRDPEIEREQGVKVHIYTRSKELTFGGDPTLGTAMVLRNRCLRERKADPLFGKTHDRETVAALIGVKPSRTGRIKEGLHRASVRHRPAEDARYAAVDTARSIEDQVALLW